jgi:cation transport regulator ChaC
MIKYYFFGYGSLLDHKSLKQSIRDKKFHQAYIKGYKRIFNLKEGKKHKSDILNLIKKRGYSCNGVLFKVNKDELKSLTRREDEYNLEQTTAYDFLTRKRIGKCFMVIDYLVSIDKGKFNPNKSYFNLCRKAAYSLSNKFGKQWDKTTFLSNGISVQDWLNKKH